MIDTPVTRKELDEACDVLLRLTQVFQVGTPDHLLVMNFYTAVKWVLGDEPYLGNCRTMIKELKRWLDTDGKMVTTPDGPRA